jgi:hypothetical protein
LEKPYTIQVGNPSVVNKLGFFLMILGVLVALAILLVLFAGTYLPLEMKSLFYFELIHKNVYLSLIISIVAVIAGYQIGEYRYYTESTLQLASDKITFSKKDQFIELPKWKIRKIIRYKKRFRKTEKIRIKTTVGKEYFLKADSDVLRNLKSSIFK